MPTTYRFKVNDCDVSNRAKLEKYRSKRTEWLEMLDGDPNHSVWKQITSMLWNDAVFRMVNAARGLAMKGGYESSARNWTIAQFVDQGFVAVQTLSIRKLMEAPASKPHRQIISLRRVLDDIRQNRDLITREHYVAHDGLPYDPQAGEIAYKAAASKQGVHVSWMDTSGPYAWDASELAHERFDKLSGVTPDKRARDDLIREDVFVQIEQALKASGWKDIVDFGNKLVAHAADATSRGTLLQGQNGLSLDMLTRCHEGICRSANAIWTSLLWEGSRGGFPIPQFNHFENLDAPWLKSDDVDTLSQLWNAHVDRVDEWEQDDLLKA